MGSTKPDGIGGSAIAVLVVANTTNPTKKRPRFAFIFDKPSSDKLQMTERLGVEILHLAVQDRFCRGPSTILTA